MIDECIRAILSNPQKVTETENLHEKKKILTEMITLLEHKPDASTATILGYFQSHPFGNVVFKLAGEEFLIDGD